MSPTVSILVSLPEALVERLMEEAVRQRTAEHQSAYQARNLLVAEAIEAKLALLCTTRRDSDR